MKIKDYIKTLQQKPEHQREKIAVIATAISFLIILVIWLVTFSEMNGGSESKEISPADQKLQDLKSDVGKGKQSIEEMWNQVPGQINSPENDTGIGGSEQGSGDGTENKNASGAGGNNQDKKENTEGNEIPQLP
jgi:hypothetical protein